MRHTRKEAEALARQLAAVLGAPAYGNSWRTGPDGKRRTIVGAMLTECNSPGDGWTRYRLCEIVNDGGGRTDNVLGMPGYTLGEYVIALRAALETAKRIMGDRFWTRMSRLDRPEKGGAK